MPSAQQYLELVNSGWSHEEIANAYGLKIDSVRRMIQQHLSDSRQNRPKNVDSAIRGRTPRIPLITSQ